jgi:hypothetical protein
MISSIDILKKMKEKGIEQARKHIEWWENDHSSQKLARVWLGLKWKE